MQADSLNFIGEQSMLILMRKDYNLSSLQIWIGWFKME